MVSKAAKTPQKQTPSSTAPVSTPVKNTPASTQKKTPKSSNSNSTPKVTASTPKATLATPAVTTTTTTTPKSNRKSSATTTPITRTPNNSNNKKSDEASLTSTPKVSAATPSGQATRTPRSNNKKKAKTATPTKSQIEQQQQQDLTSSVIVVDKEAIDLSEQHAHEEANENNNENPSENNHHNHTLKRKLHQMEEEDRRSLTTTTTESTPETRSYMRFFDMNSFYQPYAIRRMAFNSDQTLLAVARMSTEIEIWKTPKLPSAATAASTTSTTLNNRDTSTIDAMNNKWTLLKKICAKKNTSIESIAWMQPRRRNNNNNKQSVAGADRLFTAGMHGTVTEWDLDTCLPKKMSGVYGGAIWAMDIYDQTIAIACEDGQVRLYNSDLLLKQSFGPSKAETVPVNSKLKHCEGQNRLLALCFNHDGTRLFCGGLTGVYCFDLKTGSLSYKITLQASICTALCYLKGCDDNGGDNGGSNGSNSTLIVGDSAGQTLFCDAKFGTILSSHKEHLADVLQIVKTSDESKVLVTGVHSRVSMFQRSSHGIQWVHTRGKYPHNHDLYALAIYDDAHVFSGGLDGRISFVQLSDYFLKEETTSRHFGLIPATDLCIARTVTINGHPYRILFVSDNRNVVSVVQMPRKVKVIDEQPAPKKPKYETDLLLNDHELSNGLISQLLAVSKGGWTMSSFAVSPDGRTVCCCGPDFSAIFHLEYTAVSRSDNDDDDAEDDDKQVGIKIVAGYDMRNMSVIPGLHCTFVNNDIVAVASRTNESLQLFSVQQRKLVYFYDLKALNDEHTTTLASTQALYFPTSIHSICANERYIVIARGQNLFVFDVQDKRSTMPVWSLALGTEQDSVLYRVSFLSTRNDTVFYALSSHNKVAIYDIEHKSVMENVTIENRGEDMRGGIRALVQGTSSIHAHTNYSLFHLHDDQKERRLRRVIDEFMVMNVLPLADDEFAMIRFDYKAFYLTLLGVVYRKRFGT